MRNIILISLISAVLVGCSSFGVPSTSDPAQKLSYAFQLMGMQRAIPAERLAKEALDIYTMNGNVSGQSEAHFVLGVLYKSNQGHEKISGSNSYDKTIAHLSKAKSGYFSINEKIQASKATFEMAQAYRGKDDNIRYCALFHEALALYSSGEGKDKKVPI